jgi:hypothetical protein
VSRRCGTPLGTNPGRPRTNRHTIGTPASHTGAPLAANVTAEGGGTTTPTLGGGIGFSREQSPATGEVPR